MIQFTAQYSNWTHLKNKEKSDYSTISNQIKCPEKTPGNVVTAGTATVSGFFPCDQTSASTCAWSVTLGLSAFSREKAFQAPIWFIQYLANLALNLPQEISNHFSPPFPAYTHCMPPRPSSIPTCFFFSPRFRNSPLREWETGPWRRLGFTFSSARPPPNPTVGHLLITMCGPIVSAQGGLYGSLGFKWMFMSLV